MDDDQQFCLRWNNHQSTLISVFDTLLENGTLVDCTLAAEGKFLKAHKVVLSACSPYFATLLQEQYDKHPIFILKDVKYQELRAMMDYMYRGEVNISQDQLAALLKAAESLQIKGLSDNRSGAPRTEHHRGLNVPATATTGGSGKLTGGYTLEQTKRARIGPSSMDSQDLSGSREGSSSPSRRRRKVRRRSIENTMAEVHDNSNSSQIQGNQSTLLQQSNANLAGVGGITAAASAMASQIQVSGTALPTGSAGVTPLGANQGTTQQLTTSVTKKTESVKGTSDAMNTDNVQAGAAAGADEQDMEHVESHKQNHKHKSTGAGVGKDGEMIIKPKNEYDDDGNEETVEDLTLDEEDMGMDDLDHNAGTSQGGEGSSQGYAAWQHDRSQDELLLATQEAQQRDPQDLSKRISLLSKENVAAVGQIQRSVYQRSILNSDAQRRSLIRRTSQSPVNSPATTGTPADGQEVPTGAIGGNRKRLSVTAVSDMLFQLYKANAAKAPKNQQQSKLGQTSPTSAETHESSTIAAIATNGAAAGVGLENNMKSASKNLQGDEMMQKKKENDAKDNADLAAAVTASFHPRIKYTTKSPMLDTTKVVSPPLTAIPTSVVVPTSPQIDVKPLIPPTMGLCIPSNSESVDSVIKQVPPSVQPTPNVAGAIAVALLRDGYHNFQQQLRAQEILKHQISNTPLHSNSASTIGPSPSSTNPTPTKILESFLRQHREHHGGHDTTTSDTNDGDDEDDSRYNGFDDIHLVEGAGASNGGTTKNCYNTGSLPNLFQAASVSTADEPSKFTITTSGGMFEYSMSDYGGNNSMSFTGGAHDGSNTGNMADMEPVYECRHCGKKYRWKSTLRRHENVECGGKEPSHQCPYCPYKSKQRGNLGVHVRKHHSHLPQLASKRRSKYSMKMEDHNSASSTNGGGSDDSQSRLVIDCSK